MKDKYVYPYSSFEAKQLGELDEWRTSHRLNKECAEAIDNAVRDGLRLFDKSQCEENSRDMDFTDRVLVLNPSVLKDKCKTPQDQLFYANVGGFGCKPGNHGKVRGQFLSDGEETHFHRDDFIGILRDECIPEWAAQKLAELSPPAEDEETGMTMQ